MKRKSFGTIVKEFFKRNKAKLIVYAITIAVIAGLIFLAIHFGGQSSTTTEEIPVYSFNSEDPAAKEFLSLLER